MLPKTVFLLTTLLVSTSAQFFDYSTIQTSLNDLAYGAEKDLQTYRMQVSEYVLSATDEMISYATSSLSPNSGDPKSPMIAACTLYPTNWMSHHTKELNGKIAEVQSQVNAMKFAILKGLVNQPMISEAQATYAKVQADVEAITTAWPTTKTNLEAEIDAFKFTVNQLVIDMQECIKITV